jgi:hypothetical protein
MELHNIRKLVNIIYIQHPGSDAARLSTMGTGPSRLGFFLGGFGDSVDFFRFLAVFSRLTKAKRVLSALYIGGGYCCERKQKISEECVV